MKDMSELPEEWRDILKFEVSNEDLAIKIIAFEKKIPYFWYAKYYFIVHKLIPFLLKPYMRIKEKIYLYKLFK